MLKMGLRLGERPRTVITTTPRPIPLLKRLVANKRTAVTGGRTAENVHVSDDYQEEMVELYGGTRLERQELSGELIEDFEGALWTREMIERCRIAPAGDSYFSHGGGGPGTVASNCPRFERIVVGVDPPASADGDACGIIVCGLDADGTGYVLADLSVQGLSPERWAAKVAAAAEAWGASLVVAEANNGGRMVASVLKGAAVNLPVRLVHAAEGKVARAAPVAALFESGRGWFAGRFPELEDQLCGLTWDGSYHGPGDSPDRADAMIWALTELMLGPQRAEPRITAL